MSVTIMCQIRTGERGGNPLLGAVIGSATHACVAIRAERYEGRGDASIHYFARSESGEWRQFLKKDNRRLKLPTAEQLVWLPPEVDPTHRHGPYGSRPGKIFRSQEVSFDG